MTRVICTLSNCAVASSSKTETAPVDASCVCCSPTCQALEATAVQSMRKEPQTPHAIAAVRVNTVSVFAADQFDKLSRLPLSNRPSTLPASCPQLHTLKLVKYLHFAWMHPLWMLQLNMAGYPGYESPLDEDGFLKFACNCALPSLSSIHMCH